MAFIKHATWVDGNIVAPSDLNRYEDALEDHENNKVNKSDIVNNLTTTDITKVLSAPQGKALDDKIDGKSTNVFQETLPLVADRINNTFYWHKNISGEIDYIEDYLGVRTYVTVKEKSITADKLAYIPLTGQPSKNLFNVSTITAGKYVDFTTGNLITVAGYNASEFIPVLPNTTYRKTGTRQFAFYDASKIFISGLTDGTNTFTTPTDTYFVRVTVLNAELPTFQLELGSVSAGYESFGFKLEKNTILDKTIDINHLNYPVIVGIASKNLFNKLAVTTGYYINSVNGNLTLGSVYSASEFIPVLSSTTYTKSSGYQFVYYDINKGYISGVPDGTLTFTTPSNAAYVRLTVSNAGLNTFQLELGGVQTPYISFTPTISLDNLPSVTRLNYSNFIVVAKSGAYFSTVTNAVNNANDSAANPVTILIMPGVYVESVKLIGKYITLIGQNKETCIIKTFTNDYFNPPVDLSSNSNVYNLTLIADDDGVTTPVGGVNGLKAYGLHHDIAGRGYDINNVLYQGVARVKNCILISKHNHGSGVGLSNKQELIFDDCEIIALGGSTAFRAHNYQPAGAIQQKLTLENCKIHNIGTAKPIILEDPNHATIGGYDSLDTIFTFIKNVAWSDDNGQSNALLTVTPIDATYVCGYIKLGKGSFGNSIALLNATL